MDSVILEGRNGNFELEYSFREEVASLSKKEVAKIDVGYRGERIVFSGPNTNTIQFQKCGRVRIRILFGFRNIAEYEYYLGSEIWPNTNTI